MVKPWSVSVITLFEKMYPGPLGYSLIGKALQNNDWTLKTFNLRKFAFDKHRTVDDVPYGGGAGMVLKPDVLSGAIEEALKVCPLAKLVYFTPRGRLFNQELAKELVKNPLILLCGRYEGVDQRVIDYYPIEEISIGDYILCGGDVAAMVIIETCARLLPGVIGKEESLINESFALNLLEHSHYTRPYEWKGGAVPGVLLSGCHKKIAEWRHQEAEMITQIRRPDLWQKYQNKRKKKDEYPSTD